MTCLKAPETPFLVAEKFESLVNCLDGLTRVRGVGPITKRTAILGVLSSQGRPAVGNLELKGGFGTDTSLSDCPRLLFSLVSTSCRSCFLRSAKVHVVSS